MWVTSIAAATLVFVCATSGWAQAKREMAFALGTPSRGLAIQVEYLDPAAFDTRLDGSHVWPLRITVRNNSAEPQSLAVRDLRLNVGGNQAMTPVDPGDIADAVLSSRTSPIASFLGGQSSAFQPTALRARLRREQLEDDVLEPGQESTGLVFFRHLPDASPEPFNGVLWLDVPGYPSQLLATKKIDVQTKGDSAPSFLSRFTELWDLYIAGRKPPFNKSYALLIGVGAYRHLPKLESPGKDVKKMEDFLRAQGFDEVVTMRDADVTLDLLRYPQKYFTAKMQPEDRFLFYYSGHGMSVPDGLGAKGYLPLAEERPGSSRHSVAMTDLVSWVKQLSAKHLLVILDSCFSGLAIDGVELKNVSVYQGKVDRDVLSRLASESARYLLMAGNERQEAVAGSRWSGSLFTDAVIKGLRQPADSNPDRIVTTRELHVWLQSYVPREAQMVHHELTPLLKDLGPGGVSQGEFVFLR